ncbi:MAG: hypothetical protein ACK50J_28500 [Planctomyces sp.]
MERCSGESRFEVAGKCEPRGLQCGRIAPMVESITRRVMDGFWD